MSDDLNSSEVVHNPEQKRFELPIGDHLALVEYIPAGTNIVFTHTEVPPALEGQGVGSRLAKHALDYAVENGLKIQPLCPFIAAYIRRHPEYQAHVFGARKQD
ncbi:MAG: N-acetyltransferase [Chloroflexi bacterium CFX4]|nr:N-acetyltransferase [Chloroflexi bacterium CFX4]MDL1923974.1 N-acetyltransferase [Chloroflexi bacterium CFX3]